MNEYNYTPRPHVEYHHHIQELIENQEKRSADRQAHIDKIKAREERDGIIRDGKFFVLTDFWCDKCREDFKAQAVKQVEVDWSCPTQNIAFYKTKCYKGHWCIRLLTDKQMDGFYQRSKLMSLDRGNHFADIVQPWETGFQLLYGRKNK